MLARSSMAQPSQRHGWAEARPWTWMANWLNCADARSWLHRLQDGVAWEQPVVRVYGRDHVVPRLTAFMAAEGVNYHYSGVSHRGEGLPDWLYPLLRQVNAACKENFNGCLLNLYRNGNDSMGWHADDEAEIEPNTQIASLSLGATRDFCLKHRHQPLREVLHLQGGDLLIMHPQCQKEWLHALPRRKRVLQPRINLTFRCFIKSQGL